MSWVRWGIESVRKWKCLRRTTVVHIVPVPTIIISILWEECIPVSWSKLSESWNAHNKAHVEATVLSPHWSPPFFYGTCISICSLLFCAHTISGSNSNYWIYKQTIVVHGWYYRRSNGRRSTQSKRCLLSSVINKSHYHTRSSMLDNAAALLVASLKHLVWLVWFHIHHPHPINWEEGNNKIDTSNNQLSISRIQKQFPITFVSVPPVSRRSFLNRGTHKARTSIPFARLPSQVESWNAQNRSPTPPVVLLIWLLVVFHTYFIRFFYSFLGCSHTILDQNRNVSDSTLYNVPVPAGRQTRDHTWLQVQAKQSKKIQNRKRVYPCSCDVSVRLRTVPCVLLALLDDAAASLYYWAVLLLQHHLRLLYSTYILVQYRP